MSNYNRKFDWAEARRLRADGLSLVAIASRLGVSPTAVGYVVNPRRLAAWRASAALWQHRTGQCIDCGTAISRNNSRPVRRCRECAAAHKATSVQAGELRCSACREWKPDMDFPQNRSKSYRRFRHVQCRACGVRARIAYRERRKIPCDQCGRPRLPQSEKLGSRDTGLCVDCYRASRTKTVVQA